MKLNDYISIKYPFEIIPDSDGYGIIYPDLPGCISCGETIEKTIKNGEDAKKTWIESELNAGNEIPLPGSFNEYSGQFKIRLPKSLHKSLAMNAKREGISMNQYCLYLLSKNDAHRA